MPGKGKDTGRSKRVPRETRGIPFEKDMDAAAPRPSPSDPSGPASPSGPSGERPTTGPVNQVIEETRRIMLDKDGGRSGSNRGNRGRSTKKK